MGQETRDAPFRLKYRFLHSGSPMLSDAQRKYLRRLGHDRSPVVLIGNAGLGPNLVAEMDRALTDHELVKVRARVGDRHRRDELLAELANATGAELVQRIGHVALYYRRRPDPPQILLPDG
jgi:RNA-binding protein